MKEFSPTRPVVDHSYVNALFCLFHPQNDTVSLWDLGNQILDSSREILQNHADIALETGNNFTLNRNFQYLLLNGADTVSVRYRSIMDLFIAR